MLFAVHKQSDEKHTQITTDDCSGQQVICPLGVASNNRETIAAFVQEIFLGTPSDWMECNQRRGERIIGS